MKCSVDKACYTFIARSPLHDLPLSRAGSLPQGARRRATVGASLLAKNDNAVVLMPYTPASFNRCACSTNNRIGSAPLPTSPSD
jgi:hypothetical protein